MKKFISRAMFAVSILFISCSKDENKTDVQNDEASIVGVWLWQSETIDGYSVNLDSCEAQFTLTFDAANNLVDNQPYMVSEVCTDDISNGTYIIDGSKITFVYDGNGNTGTFEQDFEIVDDILTLEYTNDDGENEVAVFKRMEN